jgi:phage repressor protein C with HTH and peptisase S24 domain
MTIKERIADLLRQQGKTQKALAEFVGVEPPNVSMWIRPKGRKGATEPTSDKVPLIADFFGVAKEWLMFGDAQDKPQAPERQPQLPADAFEFNPVDVPQPAELRTYLPVLGSVRGGDGDDGDFEMNGTVIDRVKAPPTLANVRGAYGLYVQGDSMEPRYFAGELVYVHPHKGVTVGCFAVIQFKPRHDGDPVRALVKRLVGKTATKWRVEQYNPSKVYEIDQSEVLRVHRILNGDELI